ncbi:hypothetical protein TNCV_1175111 [Trichonephila clavipes]|nr:hypothetical protein TNCV_1175111 [Trichonephila clavipes]
MTAAPLWGENPPLNASDLSKCDKLNDQPKPRRTDRDFPISHQVQLVWLHTLRQRSQPCHTRMAKPC